MGKEKVILAYSGGLDTTAIIPWLKETYNFDVVCVCIDVGQESELEGLDERAKYSGAEKLYILDVVDEFCDEYILPGVKANATYEYEYLLGTSFARPLIAKKLVEIARKEGATTICHGATGKGNDQVRFEINIKALAPDLNVIATWRQPEWTMQSREDEIAFCKKHGIDLPFDVTTSYSRDRNIWHISHEGLELEDPSLEPNWDHLLVLGTYPEKAPDEAEYVTVNFEKGVPTAVNGKQMKMSDVVRELNRLGGKHGVGIKKRTDKRQIPYVSPYGFAVKKQCSEERPEKKEPTSAKKSQKHTEKKCLVCDTADLFLVSESIQLGDGGHQHHRGGSCKGGRKQEQWQSHSRKNSINFQCL